MKKLHVLLCCLFAATTVFSQQQVNLVIFSEDLEPFYAYVNGVKQNTKPETNVRVTNLTPKISLRIEFQNKVLPVLTQNMMLDEGFEHTARIKRDKKKQMKLQYFGQVPIAEAPAEKIPTVEYHTTENADEAGMADGHSQTSVSTTTITSSTASHTSPSVNINMPGVSISMNTTAPQTQIQTSTSTTVTNSATQRAQRDDKPQPAPEPTPQTGCRTAMTAGNFTKMKESVASKSFSDTKMSTARVATKNGCLSVAQVKEITRLFSMDDDKLAYAKFAYDYCVDQTNYYQVSEVFSFSTTQDELNRFLENK